MSSPSRFFFHHNNPKEFDNLMKFLSPEVRKIVRKFNQKLRENTKNYIETNQKIYSVNRSAMFPVLRKLFPFKIFGCMRNFSKFMKIYGKFRRAKIHDSIPITELTNQWRLESVTWIPEKENENKREIIARVLMWLINCPLKKFLRRFFHYEYDISNDNLKFVSRKIYQQIYDKALNEKNKISKENKLNENVGSTSGTSKITEPENSTPPEFLHGETHEEIDKIPPHFVTTSDQIPYIKFNDDEVATNSDTPIPMEID